MHQCTNAPMHQCTNAPMHQCTNAPMHSLSSISISTQLVEGVTKLRYMQFRDSSSSSASLGFRVEGVRVDGSTLGDCKRLQTPAQLAAALHWYVGGCEALRRNLLDQLVALRHALEGSEWFFQHG